MGFPRKIRSLVLIAGMFGCAAFAAPTSPEQKAPTTLSDLEKVTAKAKNLDDFLARSDLKEEYFQRLSDYYGEEKFKREAYDAVLKQLKELRRKVPAVAERLWESTNLGDTFALKVPVQSSGLDLKAQQWREYLEKTEDTLRKRMGAWNLIPEEERAQRLQKMVATLTARVAEFEASQKSLKRLDRIAPAKKFYAEFAADIAEAKEAGAYLQLQQLRSERFMDPFHSLDADLVLEAWNRFREGQGFSLDEKEISGAIRKVLLPEPLPELAKPALEVVTDPKTKARTAAETELFKVKVKNSRGGIIPEGVTSSGQVDFKALPRRFHGIWKGIPLGECVGGNCMSLSALTPERWATIALANSRLYHVEQNGSYLGFVQIVPVKKDGRVYGSIEFGAPILSKRIIQEEKGKHKAESLSRKLVAELKKRLPPSWGGLILGQSSAINNAGVQGTVRNSPAFAAGTSLSEGAAEHLDPLAKEIVAASPRESYAASYGGNMIVDATVKEQTGLKVLRPGLENKDFSRQSTGTYLTKIVSSPDPAAANRVLDVLHGMGEKVKPTIQAEELAALLDALDKADSRVAERTLGLIRMAMPRPKALAPGAEAKWLALFLERLGGPYGNGAPSLQALALLLPQSLDSFAPADMDKVVQYALRRKHHDILEILQAKKVFAMIPFSQETKAALMDFYLDPKNTHDSYHFHPESVLRNQLKGDAEGMRIYARKLEELGRPIKVNEANLALSTVADPALLPRGEVDKLKLLLAERVPMEDILRAQGTSFEPMLQAISDVLTKIPKERLVDMTLTDYWIHPGVTSRHTTYKLQDSVYRRIEHILSEDPRGHIRRLVDLYEHAGDSAFYPYPSFLKDREKLLEKKIEKLASSLVFNTMDEEAERLVQAGVARLKDNRQNTNFMMNVLRVEMRTAKRPGLRNPATFDAMLEAEVQGYDAHYFDLPGEKELLQEAKMRYLPHADSTALKKYFQKFPGDISEPWAQKLLFSANADPEAFAWAHFVGFGKNLKRVTPEAWEVLRHRLLDPESKVHARTAYFLLESGVKWPEGLLDDYLNRVITEVPIFENRFALLWTMQKLSAREGFQNPVWDKLKKNHIHHLVQSVYGQKHPFFPEVERQRTIRRALESGDPQLIHAVQAAYRASIQSGVAPAYWDGFIGEDAKVLVQPVHPWSCSGMYGRFKRTIGL